MNVLFLAPSQSSLGGGVTVIQQCLAKELHQIGITVAALGLEDSVWRKELANWTPIQIDCFPLVGLTAFGYSPRLHEAVRSRLPATDILHLHCLWMDTSRIAFKWKHRFKKPLVVSINGFLDEWALNHRRWKKRLAMLLYERRMLASADILHVNSEKEKQDVRNLGLKQRIEVISNGVSEFEYSPYESQKGVHQLSFLGRIHPKKGILTFLKAWASISKMARNKWKIAIAGFNNDDYATTLQGFIRENGLSDHVRLTGPLFGDDKRRFIQSSAAMFLTSESEGMPMSALECFANGRTLLMTKACNIDITNFEPAAIVVESSVESVRAGIDRLLGMNDVQRRVSHEAALRCAKERFSWRNVARQWHGVYSSLLKNQIESRA